MLFMTDECGRSGNRRQHADTDEDVCLVREAARGDRNSFERLLCKYERLVYRRAFFAVGNTADAEDLTQEIFLKVWRGLPDFHGNACFLTWLMRITRNACADHIRKQRRSVTAEPLSFGPEDDGETVGLQLCDGDRQNDPQAVADRNEDVRLLRLAMTRLTEEHRTLIVLRDMEGCSYERMAAMLGIEVGTVKSRLFRARAQLKEALTALGMFV